MDVDADIVTAEFDDANFDDLLEFLIKEVELRNYRVVKVINIDNIKERRKLVKDLIIGFERYKIVEICNLFTCNEIISADLRAGVFMPQKFAIYQRLGDNTVYVSYLKPTAVAGLFKSERMMKTAERQEKEMNGVLESLKE